MSTCRSLSNACRRLYNACEDRHVVLDRMPTGIRQALHRRYTGQCTGPFQCVIDLCCIAANPAAAAAAAAIAATAATAAAAAGKKKREASSLAWVKDLYRNDAGDLVKVSLFVSLLFSLLLRYCTLDTKNEALLLLS